MVDDSYIHCLQVLTAVRDDIDGSAKVRHILISILSLIGNWGSQKMTFSMNADIRE